jgi:hypothetical protein
LKEAQMKLRISGNSIRFRLTPSEVQKLVDGRSVVSSTEFGLAAAQRLTYALETSPEVSAIHACYDNATILVTLPINTVHAWATTDEVGIEENQAIGGGVGLKILIEKDFQCAQPRSGENEADRFPNPIACKPFEQARTNTPRAEDL